MGFWTFCEHDMRLDGLRRMFRARRELNPAALKTDFEARMEISAALGHGREEITTVYLGR